MHSSLIFYQSNAYVSGMETDLKLYGNELNYFTTFFKCVLNASVAQNCDIDLDSIGYMIMLYPSCIIVSHVGPSIWLPTCEVSTKLMLNFLNF